jgi:chaperone BCS1
MTSNFPDRLDGALIRPGRVDMQVRFPRPTRPQVAQLFSRMYVGAPSSGAAGGSGATAGAANGRRQGGEKDAGAQAEADAGADGVAVLADRFAARLDGGAYSPAQIQNYLLTRRTPREAMDGLPAWMAEAESLVEGQGGGR